MTYSFLNKKKRDIQWIFLIIFIILSTIEFIFTIVFISHNNLFSDPIIANIYLIDPSPTYKAFFVIVCIDAGICLACIVYWILYAYYKSNISAGNHSKKFRKKVLDAAKMLSHECSENIEISLQERDDKQVIQRCTFATYNNRLHIFYRTPIMLITSILFASLYIDRIDDFEQDLSLPLSIFMCSELLIIIILFITCISTPLPLSWLRHRKRNTNYHHSRSKNYENN